MTIKNLDSLRSKLSINSKEPSDLQNLQKTAHCFFFWSTVEKELISCWQTFIDEDKNLRQVERSKVPFVEVEENLERSRRQLETS